jgi:hypothetical protein
LVHQPDHEARAAPNLYVVTVNQALGFGDGFGVVSAGKALETDKMAVIANQICPVFCHPVLLQWPEFAG